MNVFTRIADWMQKQRRRAYMKRHGTGFLPPQYNDIELGNLMFGHSRGSYAINREKFQPVFYNWLEKNGFDSYGHYEKDGEKHYNKADNSTYKNDTFIIRPYYWGDDQKIVRLPNFHYIPTNLMISWYKYSLRDAYSNREFTVEELKEILQDCERSMKG